MVFVHCFIKWWCYALFRSANKPMNHNTTLLLCENSRNRMAKKWILIAHSSFMYCFFSNICIGFAWQGRSVSSIDSLRKFLALQVTLIGLIIRSTDFYCVRSSACRHTFTNTTTIAQVHSHKHAYAVFAGPVYNLPSLFNEHTQGPVYKGRYYFDTLSLFFFLSFSLSLSVCLSFSLHASSWRSRICVYSLDGPKSVIASQKELPHPNKVTCVMQIWVSEYMYKCVECWCGGCMSERDNECM